MSASVRENLSLGFANNMIKIQCMRKGSGSALLEIEGLRVPASLEALHCVFEQEALILA